MKVEETVPAALDGERIDRVVSLIVDGLAEELDVELG